MPTLYCFVIISSALNEGMNPNSFSLVFSKGYWLAPLWWQQEVLGSLDLGVSSALLSSVSRRSSIWLRRVQYYWKGGYKGKANTTHSSDGNQWRAVGGVGEEEMILQTHYNAVRELYGSKNYFLVVGGPGE